MEFVLDVWVSGLGDADTEYEMVNDENDRWRRKEASEWVNKWMSNFLTTRQHVPYSDVKVD